MPPLTRCLTLAAATGLVMGFVAAAEAQWPEDPYLNLVITNAYSEQVLPIPAVTSDGGCYIGWFDLSSGNYDVYLQRLDRSGTAQWADNGIPISTHPQNSSLVAWDLTVDADDNAILVFSDARAGTDLDIYAYKVAPDGSLPWGPHGIPLSSNSAYEPGAAVTVAGDGDAVFAWAHLPDAGDGSIRLQRLSPQGVERYAHGGIPILTESGADPAFVDIVPSLDGSVIVSCVRDISSYFSNRYIKAERFAADGSSVWGAPVVIYDANPVPLGYHPRIQSDEAGGLVAAWHASEGNVHQSRFQHISAEGLERHPHNGIRVSTLESQMHIDPTLAYDPLSGDAYVFWNERNLSQSQWGIYAQRIAPDGALEWGSSGRVLLPVNAQYKSYPRAVPCDGGAMVFFSDEPTGVYNEERLLGIRVDSAGTQVWPGGILEVSTYLSSKARYPVVITGEEMAILVWEDGRNGNVDLYAQNVNADGTLGVSSSSLEPSAPSATAWVSANLPNPFSRSTRFSITTTAAMVAPRLEIFDLSGRAVAIHRLEEGKAGTHIVEWHGRTAAGGALPDGVYFYRLACAGAAGAARQAVLTR